MNVMKRDLYSFYVCIFVIMIFVFKRLEEGNLMFFSGLSEACIRPWRRR